LWSTRCLLAASVLGNSLGAFTDGVLSKFTGQEKTDSGLNFSAGDCGTLVVMGKSGSFRSNSLENIVHKAVHDGHSLARDTGVGVNLFQHLINVDSIGFPPPPPFLLVPSSLGLGFGGRLLGAFATCCLLWWHCVSNVAITLEHYLYECRRIQMAQSTDVIENTSIVSAQSISRLHAYV